jgi:diguanylate cyclase (GGDEF)-like protein
MSAPQPVSNPFFQALHSTLRAVSRSREKLAPAVQSALRAVSRWREKLAPAVHSALRAVNRWRDRLAPALQSTLGAIDRWRDMFAPALHSALRAVKRGRDRLAARPSFGITLRLMIAFVGVGVLLLAANFFVEENVLVEKTTQITRIAPAPVPAPSIPQPVIEPPRAVIVQRRVVTSEPLMSELDRFEQAAQGRATTKTDESETEYQQSSSDLDIAAHAFVTQATSISGKSFQKLSSGIDDFRTHAAQVVLMVDHRQAVVGEYSTLFEDLSARVNDSVKSAWKIFGRVVARQSLLQLSADFDDLRRGFTTLASADDAQTPDMVLLLKTEQTIVDNLATNESGFRRSQGDQWYVGMRDDVARLISMRESLLLLNKQLHGRITDLSEEAGQVALLVPNKVETPLAAAAVKVKTAAGESRGRQASGAPSPVAPSPVVAGSVAPGSVAPDAGNSAPAVVETQTVTTTLPPPDHKKRILIAWSSVAFFILFFAIAVGTVLSVVRPVRRLRDATARLAKGDSAVRVLRGGVKELDTLAVSFNAMADELAVAKAAGREYQRSLEAKVEERTRQLKELAERDPLTGLPNRRELFALLNGAIERARLKGCLVGVLFFDIDNFKYLNDSMGHAFGDRVLVSLGRRLQEVTRAFGFAARLGGDEFTVVLEDAQSIDSIELAGLDVVQAFQKPLSVDGRELIVSISAGASVFPDHEMNAEALLKAADVALFRAKALGRGQLCMFTPELLEAAAAKFSTEQGLRRAIERGEFELVFQPEVHAQTLETSLVEALIRWRTPDGQVATPGEFLAVAEESGLINEITDWVLRSAIDAASNWHHGAWPEARVAINVSPRDLLDNRFVDRVAELLQQFRLPARCIEIELTESVLQTGTATIDALRRLRDLGVAIALDDFGTGYSSLASLEQLPLTRIKLDRSLIAGIDTNPRSAAIARAIIGMCQGLGLEITAEGVERSEQFALLVGQPAMYLQGYLLARPVARDDVLATLPKVNAHTQQLLARSQSMEPPAGRDLSALLGLTQAG